MFKNYFKVALRNMQKHKLFSFINISGLAIGMGCCILILLWVKDELSYDRFYDNSDNLYVATFSNGSTVTPTALAEFLKTEYPEIINTSRFNYLGSTFFVHGENTIAENQGVMTDPGFLTMFTIPFLYGDPGSALKEPYSIIISERMAEKYFGKDDPVGKQLTIVNTSDLTVTGVFKNYPYNSHIQFEFIVPVDLSARLWGYNLNTWDSNNIRTYVQLQNNTISQSVDLKISDVVEKHRPQDKRPLSLQPITRLHLYNFNGGGAIIFVYIFSILAFLILLIACINFMNLTTARSSMRAKEVGMRKVVGAHKSELIKQFFGESILLTIVSLLLGIIFVYLCLPFFNSLTEKQFTVGFLYEMPAISGIIGIAIITGIIAGCYPAIFLSHFQPVKVLKGTFVSGTKSAVFRKILVVTQFSLTISLIIGTLIVYSQLNYLRNRDLGFDKEYIIYFSIGSRFRDNIETIKTEMLQNPNIRSITLTNRAPYRWETNAGIGDVHWEGKTEQEVKMVVTSVDYDYLKTFNLEMVQGRFFSRDFPTDVADAFVVNEAAVRAMEMDSPIGKSFGVWDIRGKIIGVVKDYNFESLHNEIIPMAMKILPDWNDDVCIKINPENISGTLQYIENIWKKNYPEYPFEYNFLDETINRQYLSEEQIGRIIRYFTFLAILISCLGLYGLSSYTAEVRTKEIGIRKTLGATVPGIVLLLSKDFAKLVIAANVIAWPVAYLIMDRLLQNFAYRINIGWWVFVLAGILTLAIAFITISFQSIKAATANPIDSLRFE